MLEKLIKESGYKIEFIAEKLGMSRQNLYMTIYRGRKLSPARMLKLQELLGFDDETLKELMKEE